MIYAQVHTFNENQVTLATRIDPPDASWLPFDVPDGSWLYVDADNVIQVHGAEEYAALALIPLKDAKRKEIRDAYALAADAPVTALSLDWNGGFDSAIKLDAAKRLAEAAGQSNVTFYDVSNQAHTLSFTDALQVVITVAGTYQAQLAKKQQLMLAIDAAADQVALDAIAW